MRLFIHILYGIELHIRLVAALFQYIYDLTIARVGMYGMNDRKRKFSFCKVLAEALVYRILEEGLATVLKQVSWKVLLDLTANSCSHRESGILHPLS